MWRRVIFLCSGMLAGCHELFSLEPVADPPTVETLCPASYTIELEPTPMSRYRIIDTQGSHPIQRAACAQDGDLAQLVSLETPEELATVKTLLDTDVGTGIHIGLTQDPDQTDVAAGWKWFSGGSPDPSFWLPDEPNDADGVENGDQQIAIAGYPAPIGLLNDRSTAFVLPALCECDISRMTEQSVP
jgi:hypothetical protein